MTQLIQIFGTRLKTAGANQLFQANPVFAGAGSPAAVATFILEGTGTTTETVALFGHAFERGMIATTDPVSLRQSSTQVLLRTQLNPLSVWSDGSVKTALLAAELPALTDGAMLTAELVRGEAHPDPGPDLNLSTLLSGRTAQIRTWAPGDTTTPLWTFNPLAAIGADRWHQGPLAVSTRVETAVPPSAVQNTSGQTGVITSVRLIVDIIATKDGVLRLDVCFSNDRVMHSGGGIARFGYTIEIDGVVMYDQRPSTGPNRDLLQYSQWIRTYGRNLDGSIALGRGLAREEVVFFRPDFDLLVNSGLQLEYDRSSPVDANQITGAITNVLNDGNARPTDPYWHWGLARGAGDVGGRPEIGYRTFANALWLRDGHRNAQILAQRQFEAAATRGMYYYDWDLNRWLNPPDWPRMTLTADSSSPVGTPRETATGLPTTQRPTHNTTDHITIDHAHHGSFNWTPALLSGRRLAYDGLAARAAWAVMDNQMKANGTVGTSGPNWRDFTPNKATGRAWAPRPWAIQTRSWAWDFRDIVDCAAILPDSYPNRQFYTDNVEAMVNSVYDVMPSVAAMFPPDVIGFPMIHTDGDGLAGYMFSFIFYGMATAVRAGVGGPNLQAVLERLVTFRANSATDPGYLHRNILAGVDIILRGAHTEPFNVQTWAQAWIKGTTRTPPVPPVSEDWTQNVGEGDYHRNTLSGLAFMRDMDVLPLPLRAKIADALTMLRSERHNTMGHPHPRISPSDFFGSFFMSNSVIGQGMNWQWNAAPTILPGQSFEVAGNAEAGAPIGVVRFSGPIPRNSFSGRTPSTQAWEIVSQPEGNPFAISMGGALRLAGNPPAAGTVNVTLRTRTYQGGLLTVGDPSGTPILSEPQTVSVTVTAAAAQIVSVVPPTESFAMESSPVGTVLFTVTARGNAPITPSIQTGNSTLFEFVHSSGQQYVLRTRAAITGQIGTYPLTLRVQNAHGSDTVAVSVQVVADVERPVITAGQTFEIAETLATDTAAVPPTIAYTGGAPTIAEFTAGNDGGRCAVAISGANVNLTNAVAVRRRELASLTPTLRLANAGGEDSKPITVNIIQPWVHRSSAPSFTYIGAWSAARRLVSNYTGPLLRVRRSSDNAEQDIGFVQSGEHFLLDETALLNFVGSGNGFVQTLYDQSLEGAHLVNTTQSTQPQIVTSGAIVRVGSNNRAGMQFGSGRRLDYTYATLPVGQVVALYAVIRTHTDVAGWQRIAAIADVTPMTDAGRPRLLMGNGGISHSQTLGTSQNAVVYGRFVNIISDPNRFRIGFSGQAVEAATGGNTGLTTTNAPVTLGTNSAGHNPWQGRIAEFVAAQSIDVGSEETALYAAAGAFFGV